MFKNNGAENYYRWELRPEKEWYFNDIYTFINFLFNGSGIMLGCMVSSGIEGVRTSAISGKAIKVCKINLPNELHLLCILTLLSLDGGSEMEKVTFFWWFFTWQQSFSLASFIGSSAPSSLPHHILRLHVIIKTLASPFICPLPWHLPSFQGCRLQEDIWQVWRWLGGNYRRSGAGHTYTGSWVGKPYAFYPFIETCWILS